MGTAVWHITFQEVFQKPLQLFRAQRVVRFDRMTTDGGGDHVFSETHFGHFVAVFANFVDHIVDECLGQMKLEPFLLH